ncbi:choloylglycine hydrolase [Clostridium sp. SM-530-WT-3G]|uniref:choloylglycine hydrolase n=1 Tax=Clostridium sp. SM-530-WT-3G TaxID=2725303 RepID=UPI00145D8DC7|nr:choloylglycine hydrolase [Clostridium sp. SM-530-WT-3G]NME83603.1 choloylglycine hydrolase family protein [Clostridium sp. SM-530-WT-3G]
MCTALMLETKDGYNLFGRNMDLNHSFNQAVTLVPRNYEYRDRVTGEMRKNKYAILGMATMIDDYPAMADGFNEKGLACAGLNFPGYSYLEPSVVPGKKNIGPYDLIQWALGNFETVDQVVEEIKNLELVAIPINENTELPTLHWMVADANGKSIIIEKTKEGLKVFDNPIGVLTNSPTFDWQLTNLNLYMGTKPVQPENVKWGTKELKPLGVGLGTKPLPGGFNGVDRFVRISYLKSQYPKADDLMSGISQYFHILNNVAMPKGAVINEGLDDITIYTSCMCQQTGVYYYTTYNNIGISAVDMHKEDLDADQVKIFDYADKLNIVYQN